MSLITRCTTCKTLFKVVPDQLRISDGWVRCGQCGEIFDASQNLLQVEADEQPTAVQVTTGPAAVSPPDGAAQPLVVPTGVADIPIEPPDAPPPAVSAQLDPGLMDLPETTLANAQAAAAAKHDELPDPMLAGDEQAPSFMRTDAPRSAWHHPAARLALTLLGLALAALLLLQVLRQERDRLAAMLPTSRPALMAMCALTGCRLAPLRQIDSIVIDSSSFELVRSDTYRLRFSLRNTAPLEIAMPSIELSVTNSQDQTLSRRVFNPSEFAATSQVLAGGAEWSSTVNISVKAPAPGERVAGYRLFTFYP